ncbi:MAG: hypothetical protein ACOY93_18255 [Bacillota bacterium]
MNPKETWLAASALFLAGSVLISAPAVIRAMLYAGRISTGSWSHPDPLLERMVPGYLGDLGLVAFLLAVLALAWPRLASLYRKIRAEEEQQGQG